jgi:hypothetical protein
MAGLGFCALLPPFDGFDETAHYSYIQQIAQTGTWPRLNDPITADVDDYLKVAPSTIGAKARWSGFFQSIRRHGACRRGRDSWRAQSRAAMACRYPV